MSDFTVRHLVKGLGPGGAERLIVAQALRARSGVVHDVVYLLAHKRHLVDDLERASVAVVCLDSKAGSRVGWVLRLRRLLRDDPTDIVHVHSPAVAAVVRTVARTLPARTRPVIVGTEHNRWPRHHPLTRLANRLTIRLEAATIAVSGDVRSTVRGVAAGQLRTIVHGIDVDAVRATADRVGVRRELGVLDHQTLVVCVANFRREKALEVLIEAAGVALAEEPQLMYLLIGQGPLARELDQLVDDTGIADRFRILGYREDATRVMSAADMVTLSSRHEGLPVVIMEALALGIPVVATRAGGIAEAVGEAGHLSEVDDARGLAAGHLHLASNEAARRELAAQAIVEAQRFTIERAVAEIDAVYATVAEAEP